MLCSIVFWNCLLCDFHRLLNVVIVMNGLIGWKSSMLLNLLCS